MYQEWLWPALGGLHWLGTDMPVTGDTGAIATRGEDLADEYVVNPLVSVEHAWLRTMVKEPQKEGFNCDSSHPDDFSWGGGFGMNGCGCQVALSADTSFVLAEAHMDSEDWYSVQDDGRDAQGKQDLVFDYFCNWDVVGIPFERP